MFAQQFFPSEWHKFLTFFIPKSDSTKMRPISLASCLCKILEHMMCNRLLWWLEHSLLFPNTQFGFRRHKSCHDLSILLTSIVKAFSQNKAVSAVFLDIHAAFDNMLFDVLLQKLINFGISPNTLSFIYHLISVRYVTCRFRSLDENFFVYKGLLQGCSSTLSTLPSLSQLVPIMCISFNIPMMWFSIWIPLPFILGFLV